MLLQATPAPDALVAAIQIASLADRIRLLDETPAVRELVADIALSAGRLSKILAKRHAGSALHYPCRA